MEARDRKHGELDNGAVQAYHLLPILLNKVERYREARWTAEEAIRRECVAYGE